MGSIVIAFFLAGPARAADATTEARARLRRGQVELFTEALAEPDAATATEVRRRLAAVVAHAPALAARYPLRWWRVTSLARARALADDFAQATLDLERLDGETAQLARQRALEALVELTGLAGANRGAPPDRVPELRLATVSMLGALTYSSAGTPGYGASAFTFAMGAAYGLFEGLRGARLARASGADDAPWGPRATADLIHREFARRLAERRPDVLADGEKNQPVRAALARLGVDGREVLDACDVLLARVPRRGD